MAILTKEEILAALAPFRQPSGMIDIDEHEQEEMGRALETAILAKLREQRAMVFALRFPDDNRLCLSTVFDTEKEAQDYADSLSSKVQVVPLSTPLTAVVQVPQSALDGVIPAAIRGYLRRCSSGGMPKKDIDTVQANVDEAERLGYFKLAIAQALLAAPEAPAQDNYKAWYEEAIKASNEAGFAGASAADVIRELVRMLGAFEATTRPDSGWKVIVLDTIRSADKGRSEPHHDLIWIPSGCSLAIITHIPEEKR